MQKDKEQKAKEFWERINILISGENPYSWAVSKGINRSTFQSAYTRGTRPLDRTIDEWARLIGVDADWLKTGSPHNRLTGFDDGTRHDEPKDKLLRPNKLMDAMKIVEEVLQETGRDMTPENKAELVMMVYELLVLNPEPTQEYKDALKRTLKIA